MAKSVGNAIDVHPEIEIEANWTTSIQTCRDYEWVKIPIVLKTKDGPIERIILARRDERHPIVLWMSSDGTVASNNGPWVGDNPASKFEAGVNLLYHRSLKPLGRWIREQAKGHRGEIRISGPDNAEWYRLGPDSSCALNLSHSNQIRITLG